MNPRQPRKSICFLLILALLFLGACSDDIRTAASFSHGIYDTEATVIRSCQNDSLTQQLFHEETLSQHSCAALIKDSAKRTADKTGRGIFSLLSYVESLPPTNPFIHIAATGHCCQVIHSNTVIISYIHGKDGKKA